MIETTVESILANKAFLQKLVDEPLKAKDCYSVLRLLKALEKEIVSIEATQINCIKKYATLTDTGEVKVDSKGEAVIPPEKIPEFNLEWRNFLETKINLNCDKISVKIIEHLSLTPRQLLFMEDFLDLEIE